MDNSFRISQEEYFSHIALTSNGTIMIVGNWYYNDMGEDSGRGGMNQWLQIELINLGDPLYGMDVEDDFGVLQTNNWFHYSTAMTCDRSVVAVGGRFSDYDGQEDLVYVQVFAWVSTS